MTIRRINFYGGPGIGKSSIAAGVFSDLKWRCSDSKYPIPYNFELIQEYVKTWAWQGRIPKGFDQIKLFTEQLTREEDPLRAGVELVLSDSPLLLNYHYGYRNNVPGVSGLKTIHDAFEAIYPSLNVILKRDDKPYNPAGRFQTLEEAIQIDSEIQSYMKHSGLRYIEIRSSSDTQFITDSILIELNDPKYNDLIIEGSPDVWQSSKK